MTNASNSSNNQVDKLSLTSVLQTMSPRVREIATFAFEHPELNHTAIAEHFKVSRPRITQVLSSNRTLKAFNLLATRRVQSMVPKAIKRFDALLDKNDDVARKVAERVLENENILGAKEIIVNNQFDSMSYAELQSLVSSAQQLPRQIIDAEIVKEENEQ